MTTPLLQTKLYIPPVRPELVPRPRLIERLNAGLHRNLTLISAPAGFGKTTLRALYTNFAVRTCSTRATLPPAGDIGHSTPSSSFLTTSTNGMHRAPSKHADERSSATQRAGLITGVMGAGWFLLRAGVFRCNVVVLY